MNDLTETVSSAKNGDAHAFEALFARALPRLRAFVRLRAGGVVTARESISDVAQSVCREVLAELDDFEFRGERAFCNLLFHRAVQKILKRRRFHRQERRDLARETPLGAGGDDLVPEVECYATIVTPSEHASAREQLREVEDALAELPDEQRDAVAMSRMLGMPTSEIAAALDKTESAVRGLVHRGLATLARRCSGPGS